MANGFRRKRGDDEYVFIDGRAMRADEVVRIDLRDSAVPGQEEAASVPGASPADLAYAQASHEATVAPGQDAAPAADKGKQAGKGKQASRKNKTMREAFKAMNEDDAFALTEEAQAGNISLQRTEFLMHEDRRKTRTKYLIFVIAIVVISMFALCIDPVFPGRFHTPVEVLQSIGTWFTLLPSMLFDADAYELALNQVVREFPTYSYIMLQCWNVFTFLVCGLLLALSGMLYQNTFRNPIAAPSMLGVSNGINIALLVLVMQFGEAAVGYSDLYYLYSFIGGIAVLALVMLGGKWISGKGRFNVVNMILMGTIISQLLGVIITYVQTYFMDETTWMVYSELQNATGNVSVWMYVTLILGAIVALVPVFLFRFKLNLISFSDDESRLLGVDPTKLRIIALVCGSLMILVAQLNAGQVAMASLVIPFIVREVFGSEFRKQLGGNIVTGALVLLVCGVLGQVITIDGISIGLGQVVSVVAIPLFVWMLAIRQRSWE